MLKGFLYNSIFAPLPDLHAIFIKQIRDRDQQGTETSKDGQCPVYAQVAVEWYRNFYHSTSGHVSYKCYAGQGTSSVYLVAVDDILIAADEDAEYTLSKKNTRTKRRPIRNPRICGPAHPEHTDWNCWRAKHREP